MTIRTATRAEAVAFKDGGAHPSAHYPYGYCFGFNEPGYPFTPPDGYVPPRVTGWYLVTYSWKGGGTMGGCTSDKTNGQFLFWGPGADGAIIGRESNGKLAGSWYDAGSGGHFEASPEAEGTTKAVSEPAPGKSAFVDSPNLPVDCGSDPGRTMSSAQSCKLGVNVSSSGGDFEGTLFGEIGSVERHAAALLIVCWLTEFKDDNGKVLSPSPATKLRFFLAFMKYFLGKSSVRHDQFSDATGNVGYRPAVAAGRGTTAGCRTQRMTLALRLRKGKIASSKLVKNKALTASLVRYTCTASGNTAKINLTGPANLRKAIGKKLPVGVYRSPKAPRQSGKLSFTFGWK